MERNLLYTTTIGTLNSCSKFNQIYIYSMRGNCRNFDRNVSRLVLPVNTRTQELNYFATALFVNKGLVDSKTMNYSFYPIENAYKLYPRDQCYYFVISDQYECKNSSSMLGNCPRLFDWELYRCQVRPKVPCVQSWDYWQRDERYAPPIDNGWDFEDYDNQ